MNPGGSSTEPLSWSDPSSWDLTMHSLNHPAQAPQQHHNSNPAPSPAAVSMSSKEWEISWQPDHQHPHPQHHHHAHHNLYYPLHAAAAHHLQQQQQPAASELKPLILSQHHHSPLPLRSSLPPASSSHHQALLLPPGYSTFSSATSAATSHHLQAMLHQQHQQQQRSQHSPATLALLHQNIPTGSSILELQHDPDQETQQFNNNSQRRSYFGVLEEASRGSSNLVGAGGFLNYHGAPGAGLALKREDWSLSQQHQAEHHHHHHQQYHHHHQQVAAANEWLHGRIGLNLGGRTYFSAEDSLIARFGKRPRLNGPSVHVPLCQAEGCTADLSKAKHYHRRHKVCELHSKAPNVVANGQTQRFCQQCSRFHLLTEFDDSKRSCRKRLADHNRRRRKPQPTAANPSSSGGGAAKTEQSSEGGDQPDASEATHSSADTKPTPLLLKSASSPSGSREDKAVVKASGEEGEQSKQTTATTSGVQNEGSHHHQNISVQSTLSSSADIPLRGGGPVVTNDQLGGNNVAVYSTGGGGGGGSQNQSSSTAANSGPNLSLSSSFGSSSQLLAMDQSQTNNKGNVNSTRNNSGSQCSSIEQCSWLKTATTATTGTLTTATTTASRMNSLGSANNCNTSNSGRPIRSHNFHDLISSHSQEHLQNRSPVFTKPSLQQPANYGGLNVEGGYTMTGSLGATSTAATATTTEYFGISRNHGSSSNSGGLEDHQVLSLLESRPLQVADMGFIHQLSKENHHHQETIHDVEEGEVEPPDVDARIVVATQQHEQQKHSSCGEFKFQEMQSLRGFYGSSGSLL